MKGLLFSLFGRVGLCVNCQDIFFFRPTGMVACLTRLVVFQRRTVGPITYYVNNLSNPNTDLSMGGGITKYRRAGCNRPMYVSWFFSCNKFQFARFTTTTSFHVCVESCRMLFIQYKVLFSPKELFISFSPKGKERKGKEYERSLDRDR